MFAACGSLTSTPFWSNGVTTMKMMRRTIITSAIGVTLMLALLFFTGLATLISVSITQLAENATGYQAKATALIYETPRYLGS